VEETPQQYSARITSYVQGQNHLKVLESTPKTITRLIKGKPPSALSKVEDSGKWSILQILAHLAEGEIVMAYRLRLVVGANGTPIQAYDQNTWQQNAGYLRKNTKLALDLFTTLRENNVAFLKSLTKEQWECFGMHVERGKETVTRMAELYAGHDVNHLQQIESILKSGKKR